MNRRVPEAPEDSWLVVLVSKELSSRQLGKFRLTEGTAKET